VPGSSRIVRTRKEKAGDKVQGWLSCAAGAKTRSARNIRENSWTNLLPEESGWNPTAKAKAGQAGQDVTSQAMKNQGLVDEDRQLILSYIGTIAMLPDNNNDLQCQYIPPTLEFKDLISGGPVKLRSCTSGTLGDSCTAFWRDRYDDRGLLRKSREAVAASLHQGPHENRNRTDPD